VVIKRFPCFTAEELRLCGLLLLLLVFKNPVQVGYTVIQLHTAPTTAVGYFRLWCGDRGLSSGGCGRRWGYGYFGDRTGRRLRHNGYRLMRLFFFRLSSLK